MDDIVAVAVELDTREIRYFLTWGRVHDPIDPLPLAHVVLANAHRFALGGLATAASVCDSMSQASGAPLFYEGLLAMGRQPIPFGTGFEEWRREKAARMAQGKDLWYLGADDGSSTLTRGPHASIDDGYSAPDINHGSSAPDSG